MNVEMALLAIGAAWHRWVLCRLGRHRRKFDTYPYRGMCIYCEVGRGGDGGILARVRARLGSFRAGCRGAASDRPGAD